MTLFNAFMAIEDIPTFLLVEEDIMGVSENLMAV